MDTQTFFLFSEEMAKALIRGAIDGFAILALECLLIAWLACIPLIFVAGIEGKKKRP